MFGRWLGLRPDDNFGEILSRNSGIGPSFDLLRFLLATLILLGHTKWITGAPSIGLLFTPTDVINLATPLKQDPSHWVGFTKPVLRALVPAFFALSGFLVLGSALRLRATSIFLAHRGLRIFPALLVEVTLSALVLGPLLTELPLRDFFTDPQFARYFGNVIGHVYFLLPGVFTHNPVTRSVNVNLWTLPAEFYCYLITAVLLSTKIVYYKTLFVITFVVATIGLAFGHFFAGISTPHGPYPDHVIVYYFFCGALFYHYKDKIPARLSLFVAAVLLSFVSMMFDSLVYIAPLPLTYCTIFFGLARLPKIKWLSSGDYSYGIYLYGFPIAQTYLCVFPELARKPIITAILAFITTLLFAVLSWHVIEKHALSLKAYLPRRSPIRTTSTVIPR